VGEFPYALFEITDKMGIVRPLKAGPNFGPCWLIWLKLNSEVSTISRWENNGTAFPPEPASCKKEFEAKLFAERANYHALLQRIGKTTVDA
jgi:hypothetical protein